MTLCVIILFRALPLLTIACRCNLSQNSHFEKLSIFRKPLPFPSIVPGSSSSPSSFPISPKLTQARAQLQRCNTLCLAKLMQAIQDAMMGSEVKQAVSRHSHLIVKSVRVSTTEPTAQSADDVVEPPVGRQPSPPSYSRPSSCPPSGPPPPSQPLITPAGWKYTRQLRQPLVRLPKTAPYIRCGHFADAGSERWRWCCRSTCDRSGRCLNTEHSM